MTDESGLGPGDLAGQRKDIVGRNRPKQRMVKIEIVSQSKVCF